MNFSGPTAAVEFSLLQAACAAVDDATRTDDLFLKYLQRMPQDASVLEEYGVFCLHYGRTNTASYLLQKANARIELGDFEAARRSFESALAGTPGHIQASYGLALCFQRFDYADGADAV